MHLNKRLFFRFPDVFTFLLVGMITVAAVLQSVADTKARGRLPLVRDAEIESLLRDYTTPIFRAAGLHKNSVDVFLLNRNEFNAFVTGTKMFINTGAIMQADTPNEVIGVFAHETGHIIGGHLVRLRDRLEKAQVLATLALLAGAGAAVGGNSEAGAAIALGGSSIAQRNILAYQREEEMAADRTGVTLLNKTKQSGKGMLKTFKRLGQNPLFSSGRLDPYAMSHPLPRERVALLKTVVEASPYFEKKDPASLQLRHDFARAKIAAYAGGAGLVQSIFKKKLNGPAGTYGIAIAHYLEGRAKSGLKLMNRLTSNYPNNPYFHEIVGEMHLRSGNAKQAVKSFSKAIKLDRHQNGLLRIQLGHALIETNDKRNLDAAIKTLKQGLARDKYSTRGYGYMARAYAAKGNQALAIAATAEEKYLQGNWKAAKQFAARAQPKIKKGSPQWLRLQDILNYNPKANF